MPTMIHYTCDKCGQPIDAEEDLRYLVKVEVQAVMSDGRTEDHDRDHLLEIDEILERAADEAGDAVGDDIYGRQTFDLCRRCHEKFSRDPLGRDLAGKVGFSAN